jgi:hypothetical protein
MNLAPRGHGRADASRFAKWLYRPAFHSFSVPGASLDQALKVPAEGAQPPSVSGIGQLHRGNQMEICA